MWYRRIACGYESGRSTVISGRFDRETKMKLLVFGTGEYYERFKKWIVDEEVVALLDNSPVKQNTVVDGVKVLSPEEGIKRDYEAIVIMSFYIKAMKKQLMELGVLEERIYHFYDLRKLIQIEKNRQPVQYYGISEQELQRDAGKRIGLLSTDMALGGTAIALFYMAKVLKKYGYSIVFASMMDGPLKERLEEQGIPVITDPNLQLATMRETEWLSGFRLILCNAINYFIFLSERDLNIPTIWWLHDSSFFYDGIDKKILRQISREKLTVFSVGPIPEKALRKIVPEWPVERLLYGTEEGAGSKDHVLKSEMRQWETQGKICFVTIGFIEERKGQDILLQAIRLLEPELRKQAVFYLVGQNTSLFAMQIRKEAEQIPEIIITGPVGREEIDRMLRSAHVMICPSREDPMPTVAAEAMSYGVSCIVSDVTGTAEYIVDKQNGLIFKNGDAKMLEQKIKWCINNRDRLEEMGKDARQIYEKFFSMEVFEKNVTEIVGRFL